MERKPFETKRIAFCLTECWFLLFFNFGIVDSSTDFPDNCHDRYSNTTEVYNVTTELETAAFSICKCQKLHLISVQHPEYNSTKYYQTYIRGSHLQGLEYLIYIYFYSLSFLGKPAADTSGKIVTKLMINFDVHDLLISLSHDFS